jgi:hypothetical protein
MPLIEGLLKMASSASAYWHRAGWGACAAGKEIQPAKYPLCKWRLQPLCSWLPAEASSQVDSPCKCKVANLRTHKSPKPHISPELTQISQQVKDLGDTSDFDDYHTIRLALDNSIECATFLNLIQPSGKKISYSSTFFFRTMSD